MHVQFSKNGILVQHAITRAQRHPELVMHLKETIPSVEAPVDEGVAAAERGVALARVAVEEAEAARRAAVVRGDAKSIIAVDKTLATARPKLEDAVRLLEAAEEIVAASSGSRAEALRSRDAQACSAICDAARAERLRIEEELLHVAGLLLERWAVAARIEAHRVAGLGAIANLLNDAR